MILIVWFLALGLLLATIAWGVVAGGIVLVEGLRRDRTAADRMFRILLAGFVLASGWAAITRDFPLLFSIAILLAAACFSMLAVSLFRHLRETFFD
ncbi:MAG: hypothetical protein IT452_03230 [Planctomycetia bacterium]|nr:hypothetical protein [Planctomycetia bacterium]